MSNLPARRAFVVQISGDTKPLQGSLEGRVEHLNSGKFSHFSSQEGLIRFLNQILLEDKETADAEERPGVAPSR